VAFAEAAPNGVLLRPTIRKRCGLIGERVPPPLMTFATVDGLPPPRGRAPISPSSASAWRPQSGRRSRDVKAVKQVIRLPAADKLAPFLGPGGGDADEEGGAGGLAGSSLLGSSGHHEGGLTERNIDGLPRHPDRRDPSPSTQLKRGARARFFSPDWRELSRDGEAGRLAQYLAPIKTQLSRASVPQRDVGPEQLARQARTTSPAAFPRAWCVSSSMRDGDRRHQRGRTGEPSREGRRRRTSIGRCFSEVRELLSSLTRAAGVVLSAS